MKKKNQLSISLAIILASLILGGSFYVIQVKKQNSIEKQECLRAHPDAFKATFASKTDTEAYKKCVKGDPGRPSIFAS